MADEARFSTSLQESVLTLLCFDDEKAQAVVGLLDPELFEAPYADIADRALQYRARYKKAPGREHIDDLFDHVLENSKDRRQKTYRRILRGLIEQSEGLNVPYVISRVNVFVRQQRLKLAVLEAGQRYEQGGEDLADDVERIMFEALKFRVQSMDPGVFMNDQKRALAFFDLQNETCLLGIPDLDLRQIVPTKKELLFWMAGRGRGKTWALQHCGKQALMQRWKVCHVSLEMTEDRLLQRYFQMLFSITKRGDEFSQTVLEFDKLKRLSGLKLQRRTPKISFDQPETRAYLSKRMDEWGARLRRICIKQFPTGSLSIRQLESYLDGLERIFNFVPDMLIVDYPELMTMDAKADFRLQIGEVGKGLRRIAVERNMAVVTASQSNRAGETATDVGVEHTAEDISKMATADNAITYSQTLDERILGLARLSATKVRNDEGQLRLLITQNYNSGQFVLQSTRMLNRYWEQLKELKGEQEDKDDDEDD